MDALTIDWRNLWLSYQRPADVNSIFVEIETCPCPWCAFSILNRRIAELCYSAWQRPFIRFNEMWNRAKSTTKCTFANWHASNKIKIPLKECIGNSRIEHWWFLTFIQFGWKCKSNWNSNHPMEFVSTVCLWNTSSMPFRLKFSCKLAEIGSTIAFQLDRWVLRKFWHKWRTVAR